MEGPTQAPTQPPLKHGDNTVYIKKSVLVVIGVIAFIALNLTAYTIYKINTKNTPPKTQKSAEPSPVPASVEQVGPQAPKIDLLRKLPAAATESEKKDQENLLLTNRRDSAVIFIASKCNTSPTVANVLGVEQVKISNEDAVSHTLIFDSGKKYKVEPNTLLSVKISEFQKNKFYSYTCDGTDISGYIYIPK